MLLVLVPNQMPNDWKPALAVNSATRVGMLDGADGVADDQKEAELWSVLTLIPLDGNRFDTIVCRLASLPGAGPMTDCAGLLATKGSANAGTLAARPSSAAISFIFMSSAPEIQRIGGFRAAGAECMGRLRLAGPRGRR